MGRRNGPKQWVCTTCEKHYAELEEAEVCEQVHVAHRAATDQVIAHARVHGLVVTLPAQVCAFCEQVPCRCYTPEPPRVLAAEQILRLGALTLEAERSEALEQLLDDQEAVYLTKPKDDLVFALRQRDRYIAQLGRQVTDQRTGSRLLREFMRAALYAAGGRPRIAAAEAAIRRLGGEEADARQLKRHGSTLGPLEPPEVVAEQLADGTRKMR